MQKITDLLENRVALSIFVLIFGSALVYAWVAFISPRLTSLPHDFSYTADVVSYDDFYDDKDSAFTGPVRSDTQLSYKITGTNGSTFTVENMFDVRKPTGEPIISITRNYAVDSQTKQHVPSAGDKSRIGYLFAPRGQEIKEFTYWHVNYDVPITMKLTANETVAGLQTVLYESNFTADQTSSLTSLPEVGKTRGISTDVNLRLWIEPVSGHLVKYEDKATAYYYNLATGDRTYPWNKFSNVFSFNSVATQARFAEQERQSVLIVSIAIPVILVLATISTVFWLLAARYRRLGFVRLSAIGAIVLAVCSLLYWYTIGLTAVLPEWLEPMYPGASLGVIIVALLLFMGARLQESKPYSVLLLLSLLIFSLISLDGIVNVIPFGLDVPVVGGYEPFILPIAALVAAAFAATMLLKPYSRIGAVAVVRELITAAATLLSVMSIVGYAFSGDFESLIRLPASIAYAMLGVAILASEPRWLSTRQMRQLGRGAWLFAAVLLGMLIVTGLAWQATRSGAQQQSDLQFQSDVNTMQNAISDRLRIYSNALYGAQSLFAASDNVSRKEWASYVDGLRIAENYPGVQGIGYAQIVPRAQLNALTESIRKQGFPAFTVRPLEPARDVYSSIIYLEPFDERNQRAFGFDMLSEPTRRAALESARDTGEVAMTGRVTLLQETEVDVQYGFLMYVPVFKKNVPLSTVEDRRAALLGYVYSPFRMNNFMQAIVGTLANGIEIEVFDGDAEPSSDTFMYASSKTINEQSRFRSVQDITVAGHTWSVRFTGSSDYTNSLNQSLPNVVLIGGIVLSFTLAAAVFGLSSSRQRAVVYAQRLTRDLAHERDAALATQAKDEAILSSMAEGLLVLDMHGKIQKANNAAISLFGYHDVNDLVGKYLSDAVTATDENGRKIADSSRPINRVLRSSVAIPDAKLQYERKDGSRFWALISVAPIMNRGKVTGAIELFRDITAERALENAKDEFLSVASHQLRTPITAERWYLDILLDGSTVGKLSKKQEDIARKVAESNVRMAELVSALLNVSRAESGRMTIEPRPTDVSKLVEGNIDDLSIRFANKQQEVVRNIEKTPIVSIDATLVSQIIVNLLTNASKYSPEKTKIFVTLAKEGKYLVCTVRDQGYGIPKDQQSRLFTKFFRADNAAVHETDGNGLGLYLVKTIVELSGGTIGFESKENQGTTFRFTLPIAGSKAQKGVVKLEEKKG